MTTETPGYRLTIRAFVAADPDQPGQMARAAAMVDSLAEQLERMGLHGATVEPRFVSRRRLPSSPPAAASPAAAPDTALEPATQAAAEPADAAAASDTSGPSVKAGSDAGHIGPTPEDQAAGKADGQPAADCAHNNQKRYGNGTVVCLDCQAVVTEVAA